MSLYLIKVAAGIFLGWFSKAYYPELNDYWSLHSFSLEDTQILLSNPDRFFSDIIYSGYEDRYAGFFSTAGSYWNDLANNLVVKVLAILNLITGGNFYINTLFLNFFTFTGCIALFRIFQHIYSTVSLHSKWPVIIGCFLLPSTLYFTSVIHKDSIVFTMLAFLCYGLYFMINKRITARRLFLCIIAAIGILFIRNYVFFALVPASIALYLSHISKKSLRSFVIVYAACACIFILLSVFKPDSGPIQIITQRQHAFLALPTASTEIALDTLKPTFKSFVVTAPMAVEHGILRPYVWEFPDSLLLLLAVELLIYQLLFIYMFTKTKTRIGISDNSFHYFNCFFVFTILLFIGYIVPNAGSLVRYRSIYLPFLITPVIYKVWISSRAGKSHYKN